MTSTTSSTYPDWRDLERHVATEDDKDDKGLFQPLWVLYPPSLFRPTIRTTVKMPRTRTQTRATTTEIYNCPSLPQAARWGRLLHGVRFRQLDLLSINAPHIVVTEFLEYHPAIAFLSIDACGVIRGPCPLNGRILPNLCDISAPVGCIARLISNNPYLVSRPASFQRPTQLPFCGLVPSLLMSTTDLTVLQLEVSPTDYTFLDSLVRYIPALRALKLTEVNAPGSVWTNANANIMPSDQTDMVGATGVAPMEGTLSYMQGCWVGMACTIWGVTVSLEDTTGGVTTTKIYFCLDQGMARHKPEAFIVFHPQVMLDLWIVKASYNRNISLRVSSWGGCIFKHIHIPVVRPRVDGIAPTIYNHIVEFYCPEAPTGNFASEWQPSLNTGSASPSFAHASSMEGTI
ncbi:hypothetical protein EDD15DRAFT_2205953 [Pisolithus albus]|nr:hypothetical protein EDD15DRAFT_2205953 [Pisolithus albus]